MGHTSILAISKYQCLTYNGTEMPSLEFKVCSHVRDLPNVLFNSAFYPPLASFPGLSRRGEERPGDYYMCKRENYKIHRKCPTMTYSFMGKARRESMRISVYDSTSIIQLLLPTMASGAVKSNQSLPWEMCLCSYVAVLCSLQRFH